MGKMQMATCLTSRKPTQRKRKGRDFRGSAGVRERGMYGEKCQELGRLLLLLQKNKAGRPIQSEKRTANADRNSDLPIVLRERESRPHGEGVNGYTQPAKETLFGLQLRGIVKKAKQEKNYRFGNLYGLLDKNALYTAWIDINKKFEDCRYVL